MIVPKENIDRAVQFMDNQGKNRLSEHQVRLVAMCSNVQAVNVARTARKARGKLDSVYFGTEQSPGNTVFTLQAEQTYLFASEVSEAV